MTDSPEFDDEATAISMMAIAFEPLDQGARERVLKWAKDRFVSEPTYLSGAKFLGEAADKLKAATETARAAGIPKSTIDGLMGRGPS